MSEAVWVALITVVLGGGSGYGGSLLLKRLNKHHDQAIVDDLVTARLQKELGRAYERIDEVDKRYNEMRLVLDAVQDRADKAETRADVAEADANRSRIRQAEMLAFVERLERMVPPPPPARPWEMGAA